MIPVQRYLHATVLVRDLERSRAFYRGVLGLEEIERPRFDFKGTWFGIGDQELHLVVRPDLEAVDDDRHIALGVPDFDRVPGELERLGIPFWRGKQPTLRQIFFRDPDGNLIELQPV